MVKFNFENSSINERMIYEMESVVSENHKKLHDNPNIETDFRGWIDLPENYDKEEFERIKKAASKIQSDSDVLVVIGIGGSYLGARAVIEAVTNCFNNMLPAKKRKMPMIVYAGNNLSSNYLTDLLNLIGERDISINVISKSGTTTEPAIAFRVLREAIETKYGVEEAKKRIYVTTDKKRGALKGLADQEGYETFVIPDNVGGRFSVLTAVGLLPIATAGVDIDKLMQGAKDAREKYMDPSIKFNDCYKYAVVRNLIYNSGKKVEVLANYEPQLHYMTEWWKQLYGESEGKEGKGIFPAGVDLTTDLHSMGQYIQDGERILMETVLAVEEPHSDIIVKEDAENADGLNYLAGKGLDYINKKAMEGTIEAHVTGNVPNMKITIDKLDEENLGHLIYFFEKACAMSGLILGVNPFNQPGVEEYKSNMFRLLEKPGYC